jgi:phosphoenolpyruvate-protein phosphotransferase/dihydroxyacetone kinase phosphotransfer subunit
MIGLVIVSHSKALASSLVDLARQIASPNVPLAFSGGVGDGHQEFGTDTIDIMDAIQRVYGPDGVLVLMDLGSAVLSTEMALDLLPEDMRSKIMLCPAPVVEGTISAAVQASLGSDLQTAFNEARQSLLPKLEHLGFVEEDKPASTPVIPVGISDEAQETILDICNTYGLHARPAAQFVKTSSQFDAQIQVFNLTNGKGPANAKSMNAVATLGAVQGNRIRVIASGVQAEQALRALQKLAEDNFSESTEPLSEKVSKQPPLSSLELSSSKKSLPSGAEQAIPIAEGIALAPVYHYHLPPLSIPEHSIDDPQVEWMGLQAAISKTKQIILDQRRQTTTRAGEAQAAIFDAHLLILEDPEMLEAVKNTIFIEKKNGAFAWNQQVQHVADQYAALEDPYMKQRSVDVIDVGNQVLYALFGEDRTAAIQFSQPVVLVAEELTPAQTTQLDLKQVFGVLTVVGGPTSHSAILARSLGIPAITGAPNSILQVAEGTLVGLDGFSGAYWVAPSPEVQDELESCRMEWIKKRDSLLLASRQPAVTLDGHKVEVAANVGNLKDAQTALKNGADGIGLLRTEFLFLTRQTPPDEEEQYTALCDIGSTLNPYPVIVRTLDVGGDKPLPYIDLPPEANPFLGVRAIRLCLQKPDLFRTQLRAILRAALQANLLIMFPMIAGIEEVRQARQALLEAHQSLEKEGIPHRYPIETGIMVEIPSSALLAPSIAPEVDFFSIGTNDLTQYTLAAERGNPSLSYLADAMHPAVLNLIQKVAEAAHQHGKWVGVCGELAGDPVAAPILVGLGVDELSMNAGTIPKVKALLRGLYLSDMQVWARQVLNAEDALSARELARSFVLPLT